MSNFVQQVKLANIYLQPVQFFLSIIFNTITIRILYCRALRKSSCTHYLLAYAIFSIIYMSEICPTQILRAYNIDPETYPIGCKIFKFIINIPPALTQIMLLLASCDRFCSSSISTRLNANCTVQKAKRNIVIVTVVATITMLPVFIVYYWNETFHVCLTYTDVAALMYIFTEVIVINVVVPLSMALFGCLTIYNIRKNVVRVRPERILHSSRRAEGQLARMLILQTAFTVITTVPYIIIFTINTVNPSSQTSFVLAIRSIIILIVQSQFYISFLLYIISGQIYRQEFIKIIRKIQSFCARVG